MNTTKVTRLVMLAPVYIVVLGMFAIMESCGSKSGSETASSSNATASNDNNNNDKLGPLIQIPVYVREPQSSTGSNLLSDPGALRLAGSAPGGVTPSAVAYSLAGCASGLSGTPASTSVVNVYLHDTLCYVTLVSFTMHGTVYNLTNSGFVTWNTALSSGTTGQYATFASSTAGDVFVAKVISQLSSPISTSDYVSFELNTIQAGVNSASITVGTAQSLYTAGQDAPAFKINANNITFNTITAGVGYFTFTVTCATGTSGNNGIMTGANFSFCPSVVGGSAPNGVDVNSAANAFSYKLILDASGVGTLTMAAAQAAFASGDSTVSVPSQLIVNSSSNTGFVTSSLAGPGLMATSGNQKMLLVLQAKNTAAGFSGPSNSSFQYFPISYTLVTP